MERERKRETKFFFNSQRITLVLRKTFWREKERNIKRKKRKKGGASMELKTQSQNNKQEPTKLKWR